MILLSHPRLDGNPGHVARALDRAGVLGEFWTCRETLRLAKSQSASPFSPCVPADREGVQARHRALCQSLDREVSARLAADRFQGVYAFEGAAEASFRTAGRHGLLRCYDLPAGHWHAAPTMAEEESARDPLWAEAAPAFPLDEIAAERKSAELGQADLVMVPSSFLLQTLERVAPARATLATLIPGAATRDPRPPRAPAARREKLRALFVGRLCQLKGLGYLFRACRELRSDVSLTVMSPPPAAPGTTLTRALGEVAWRPAGTHEEMRAAMTEHDVLVAPSLFDGFDTTIPEALACGLPVIATPHTVAPDLIEEGREGFIVPIRSSEQIAARLELLRREPELLAQMSAHAVRCAQRHTWLAYEASLASAVVMALRRAAAPAPAPPRAGRAR